MAINTALGMVIIINLLCSPVEREAFTSIYQRAIAGMCRLPGNSCASCNRP